MLLRATAGVANAAGAAVLLAARTGGLQRYHGRSDVL